MHGSLNVKFIQRDHVGKGMQTFYEQKRINYKLSRYIMSRAVLHISVVQLCYLHTQITTTNRAKNADTELYKK